MKRILTILAVTGALFSACHKDYIAPDNTAPGSKTPAPGGGANSTGHTSSTGGVAVNDTTTGYIKVQMAMNATATDNILIEFNPKASAAFSGSQDARTFQGFGAVSLSSLSSDNVPLAINQLPLVSSGTSVGLVVGANATGQYKLSLTTVSSTIPSAVQIWLKDKHNKDSLDFRKYPSYAFNINKSDSTTYGGNRFSLVLREK